MSELGSGSPTPQTTVFLSCPKSVIDSDSDTQYPILRMTYTSKLLSSQITQNESFLISQTFKYMSWVREVTKWEPSSLSGLLTKISSLVILMHTKFQMFMYTHTCTHNAHPSPFPLCVSQSLGETLLSWLHLNLPPPNVPFPTTITLKIGIDVNPGVERGINLLPGVSSVSNPTLFAHTIVYSAPLLS